MDFRIEARQYSDPDVVRMVADVQAEYVALYGGGDESVVEDGEFVPPNGLFLVGLLDGAAVAMGGWRRMPEGAEIKRMYVAPAARRRGLARRMLDALESTATAAGIDRFILNTGDQQPEAMALYETSGYKPIDGFGLYACHAGARFYGKSLR